MNTCKSITNTNRAISWQINNTSYIWHADYKFSAYQCMYCFHGINFAFMHAYDTKKFMTLGTIKGKLQNQYRARWATARQA